MYEEEKTIFSLSSALYLQGAPVLIETGTLSITNERSYIRLRFKNLQEKTIVFLQVWLYVLDAYGMEVKSLKRNYVHLNAEPSASFGEENAIEIVSNKARRFFVHVSEVRFADESVWASAESSWSIAPSLEDETPPFRFKDLYYCRCGHIGKYSICSRCQSNLNGCIELEEDDTALDTRSLEVTQSADVSFSKNDAGTLTDEFQEEKVEEQKPRFEDIKLVYGYSKKEKIKRALITTGVTLGVVGLMGLWIGTGIAKNVKYKTAISYLDEGRYAEAVQSFTELGDYKKSEEYLEKANNYYLGNFRASLTEETKEFVVPYGVTEIIPSAFENCWWLESVVLPDSVEKIGDRAFYGCTSLENVQFSGVHEIGDEAFYSCSSLKSFPFSASVSSIGDWAFYCCSAWESIDFSYGGVEFWETPFGGIRSIGENAFSGCNSVTEVTLASSLEYIGKNAFLGCEKLESFKLEKVQDNFSVASEGLFEYTNLKTATVVAELVPVLRLVEGLQSLEITSGDIPDKVDIGYWNDHTEDWQTLVLREGVTSIGERAFENASITEVVFPSTLREIRTNAFAYTSLQNVTFNGIVALSDGWFGGSLSSQTKVYARNIDDWQNTSFASSSANPLCYGGKLYFTENCDLRFTVEEVSPYAFYGCSGIYADGELTQLVFADTVKSIGKYAFYNCSFLTSVVAGELNEVGDEAFSGCSGLKSVSITDVQTLGYSVFYGVNALEEATASTTVMSPLVNTSKSTLKTARFTRGEKVEEYTFYNCKKLTTVSLLEGLTGISNCAFYGCESLTAITLPNTVVNFGGDVFAGCTALMTIYYKGAQSEWENIGGYLNFEHPELTVYFYSESKPTDIGNYWYYEGSIPVIWGQELEFEKIDGKEEYRVTGIGNITGNTITIPSMHEDLPVTEIGSFVFQGNTTIETVIISNGIIKIGKFAFNGCTSLTSVIIPESVTDIDISAFEYCTSLTSVIIPESVTTIGTNAFAGCTRLTSIVIPNSVTSMGVGVFKECGGLTKVYYKGTASEWSELTIDLNNDDFITVTVYYYSEEQPTDSGNYWYYEGATPVIWEQALEFEKIDGKEEYRVTGIGNITGNTITIPSMHEDLPVTEIGSFVFQGNTTIETVIISNGIIKIGDFAFYNCRSLTSVIIPESVTYIGDFAFDYCSSLTSIIVNENNSTYKSINGDLYSKNGVLVQYTIGKSATSFTIPDGVTSIGDSAFSGCSSLTSVIIPESVTDIGDSAFRGCSSLTSVIIPARVTYIGDSAFSGCSGLTSVIIPERVTYIRDSAFSNCTSLTSVIIPESVTDIGDSAFRGCSSLTSVIIPERVTYIGDSAFSGCSGLTSVIIPESVTDIGYSAFSGCSGLTSVIIPESVTYIGDAAFRGCSSLTSVIIPESVTTIGTNAFVGCTRLTSIVIPNSVTSMGVGVFKDCGGLTKVYYKGTASEWSEITIGSNNDDFMTVTVYYYSEEQPTNSGNYWYYREDGEVVIW